MEASVTIKTGTMRRRSHSQEATTSLQSWSHASRPSRHYCRAFLAAVVMHVALSWSVARRSPGQVPRWNGIQQRLMIMQPPWQQSMRQKGALSISDGDDNEAGSIQTSSLDDEDQKSEDEIQEIADALTSQPMSDGSSSDEVEAAMKEARGAWNEGSEQQPQARLKGGQGFGNLRQSGFSNVGKSKLMSAGARESFLSKKTTGLNTNGGGIQPKGNVSLPVNSLGKKVGGASSFGSKSSGKGSAPLPNAPLSLKAKGGLESKSIGSLPKVPKISTVSGGAQKMVPKDEIAPQGSGLPPKPIANAPPPPVPAMKGEESQPRSFFGGSVPEVGKQAEKKDEGFLSSLGKSLFSGFKVPKIDIPKMPELDLPLPDQEGSDVSSPFAKKKSPGDELLENNTPYGLNDGKSKSLTSSNMKSSKTIQSAATVPPIKGKETSNVAKISSDLQSKQVAGQGFKADKLGSPKVGLSSDMKSSTLGKVGVIGGPSKVGPIGELKSKGTIGELKSMGKVGIASKSVGKVGLVSKSLGKATPMVGGVKKIIKAPNKFESKSLGGIGIGKAGESRIRKLDLKSGTFLSGMKKGNMDGESSKTPGIDKSKDMPVKMNVLKMKGADIPRKSSSKDDNVSNSDSPSDNVLGFKSEETLDVSQPMKQLELKSVGSGSEPKLFGAAPGKTTSIGAPPSPVGLKGAESETGNVLKSQNVEGGGADMPVKKFEPKAVGFGSKISAPVKKFEPKSFGGAPGKAANKGATTSPVGDLSAKGDGKSSLCNDDETTVTPKLKMRCQPPICAYYRIVDWGWHTSGQGS